MTECECMYVHVCVSKCTCVTAHVQMLWSTCGRTGILSQSFLIFHRLQYAHLFGPQVAIWSQGANHILSQGRLHFLLTHSTLRIYATWAKAFNVCEAGLGLLASKTSPMRITGKKGGGGTCATDSDTTCSLASRPPETSPQTH